MIKFILKNLALLAKSDFFLTKLKRKTPQKLAFVVLLLRVGDSLL